MTPATALAASVYYVEQTDASCTNSGPGSAATPFCSIAPAALRASAGDRVLVGSGIYSEKVSPARSGTASAPIVFRASNAVVRGKAQGLSIRGRSWIVVQGFEITQTTGAGIYVSSSSFVTIESNYVHDVGKPVVDHTAKGIHLTGATDSMVMGNLVERATDAGIAVTGGSARVTVARNRSTANARGYTRAAAGIDVRSSGAVIVEANRSWANEDSGINVWDSSGAVVRNNVAYRNGDHGIDNKSSTGTAITANTVYRSVDSGIEVVSTATGVSLANNISVDNGINSPRTSGNIRVSSSAAGAVSLDDDVLWLSASGVMVDWAGTKYKTLAAFVLATGRESRGISTDPRFAGATVGDFHLLAGSAAIDSANSGARAQPSSDADGRPRVDDPATPNTGMGTRTFDDRGAHEFGP